VRSLDDPPRLPPAEPDVESAPVRESRRGLWFLIVLSLVTAPFVWWFGHRLWQWVTTNPEPREDLNVEYQVGKTLLANREAIEKAKSEKKRLS
jgi:hypothetical protein